MTSAAFCGMIGIEPRSAPMTRPKMTQQQQQVQELAQPIEAHSPDQPQNTVPIAHAASKSASRQTFSSMRAALPDRSRR